MRGREKPQQFVEPPVKVGQVIELEIINEGAKGDGVSRFNNYVIFVPGAHKGENVKAKVTKALPRYGFAEKL